MFTIYARELFEAPETPHITIQPDTGNMPHLLRKSILQYMDPKTKTADLAGINKKIKEMAFFQVSPPAKYLLELIALMKKMTRK